MEEIDSVECAAWVQTGLALTPFAGCVAQYTCDWTVAWALIGEWTYQEIFLPPAGEMTLTLEGHPCLHGPEHVSNKGPCRPCYILREVQFVVSNDLSLDTLHLPSCMDMEEPSMKSLVPCRSWLLMVGCPLPMRWSDTLTNCHHGVKMTFDLLWEPPVTFAYFFFARSCLGKVPGGAPFSQLSKRATACTIRMQIVKQINKETN